MRSSGINVTSRIEYRECDGRVEHRLPYLAKGERSPYSWPCTFAGEVDVSIDPDDYTAAWECPRCGTLHDVAGEVFS